jgi:endo-1,4-beta-D-glucanase Y
MKFTLPFIGLVAWGAFLVGCSSSGSSLSPSIADSSASVVVASSTSSGGTSSNTTALPSGANAAYAVAMYSTWKAGAVVTMESDIANYPTLAASEFSSVFSSYMSAGLYPARIRWDAKSGDVNCKIDDPNASGTEASRGCVVSEGIGYGMLIALFQGDWDTFNRLWYYNKGYRTYSSTDLMPWEVNTFTSFTPGGSASATDADMDIAASLVLAYYKTGNTVYLDDAKLIINALWTDEINPSNYYIYSGNTPVWKNEVNYNLSYFSPVALRLFAVVDPSHNWTAVLNAGYAYMAAVQAGGGSGLLPDWSDATNNAAVKPINSKDDDHYWQFYQEAVRIPWRLAWDYYWTAEPRAKSILDGIAAFISTRTGANPAAIQPVTYSYYAAYTDSIITGYSASGYFPYSWKSQYTTSVAPHFLGAWCLAGMAGYNSYAWLNSCTNTFNGTVMSTTYNYFPQILQMMYSELLNGLFVKPAGLSF